MYGHQFAPVARRQADAISAWWYSHRPLAPMLFDQELDAAVDLACRHPDAGEAVRARGIANPRRLVLPKTGYIVLYTSNHAAQRIDVVRVRSGKRKPMHRRTG